MIISAYRYLNCERSDNSTSCFSQIVSNALHVPVYSWIIQKCYRYIPIDVWSFIFRDGRMVMALPSFIFVITIPYIQLIPEFMIILSSCFHTQFWGCIIFGQCDHCPLLLKIINLIEIHERLGKNYTSKLFKKNKQTKKLYALRS